MSAGSLERLDIHTANNPDSGRIDNNSGGFIKSRNFKDAILEI